MAFNLHNDDSGEDFADINIIPLVDVMLVLLIIFMVTAPLSIGGIKVDLPFSKAKGGHVDESRIVLTVTSDGKYFFDKLEVPATALNSKMKAIFEFREKKELYIRADRVVPYGKVVDAMSAAKMSGVSKMSMLTQPPNKSGRG